MMASSNTVTNDHSSITWHVQSFAISNDFSSPGPAQLLLDHANAEFGLVYQTEPGVAVMTQFPDTDEPIFFQVSKARAACTRLDNEFKKVCVLMQHFQLDLHFETAHDASDFLLKLRRTAAEVGNLHFELHDVPRMCYISPDTLEIRMILTNASSKAIIARNNFSMVEEGYANHSCQSWMAVPNESTSKWARYVLHSPYAPRSTDIYSIYKTGKCTDFTIIAGGMIFPVHRVL